MGSHSSRAGRIAKKPPARQPRTLTVARGELRAVDEDPLGITAPIGEPSSLAQLIEAERARLMFADSVLTCLHEALIAAEVRYRADSSCADVAVIARSLVREAGHRLDSVFVNPLIDVLLRGGSGDRRRRPRAAGR